MRSTPLIKYITVFCTILLFVLLVRPASAYVEVRISIKFILSASGTRPATGNLNTDAEINGEVDWGNTILAASNNMSELRLFRVELVDLTGVSQWYTTCPTAVDRDNLRSAAIADPTTYRWRTDAVNIYINGASGCASGAISNFPPDNNIILVAQICTNTPSCILHELGHSLDLLHTHQSGGDQCGDTIMDDDSWSRDQIAQFNFGVTYANLTAVQQDQVDLVFNNVMSYHTSEPQLRFSVCQLDRLSGTADDDRAWLLVREPVYVRYSHTGTQNGRFDTPYKTLEAAEVAGLANRVVVLHQGNNPVTTTVIIDQSSQLVPRLGTATVGGNDVALYNLPTDLEESSESPEVRESVRAAQTEDEAARQAEKEAREAESMAKTKEERAAIKANAEVRIKRHQQEAIAHLRNAEKFAEGENRAALLFEIAQRYRDAENCDEAAVYFNLTAEATGQVHLREHALYQADHCREMLEMRKKGLTPGRADRGIE